MGHGKIGTSNRIPHLSVTSLLLTKVYIHNVCWFIGKQNSHLLQRLPIIYRSMLPSLKVHSRLPWHRYKSSYKQHCNSIHIKQDLEQHMSTLSKTLCIQMPACNDLLCVYKLANTATTFALEGELRSLLGRAN